MKKATNILLLLAFVCYSCNNPKILLPVKYLQYMEDTDGNYRKEINYGNTHYVIQLATAEYMACKENISNEEGINMPAIQTRLTELKDHIFFIINISTAAAGAASVKEGMVENAKAESMVMYFQDNASKDIKLKSGERFINPDTYLFENNYGLASHNTIVVGFEKDDSGSDYQLVFNDRYNQNPYIKASYTKTDFENLPTLLIK